MPPPAQNGPWGDSLPEAVANFVMGRPPERYHAVASAPRDVGDPKEEEHGQLGLSADEGRKVDIPTDAYGAAILAFARDVPILWASQDAEEFSLALWATMYSMAVLVLNLLLQGSILIYVYHYVITANVAVVQRTYQDFHAQAFTYQGVFLDSLWDAYDGKDELCEIAMWNRPFFYSVLLCWTLVMVTEIKKSEELLRNFFEVPICDDPGSMLVEEDGDRYVIAFTWRTRFFVIMLVGVPKVIIALVLLFLGCELLSATIDFETLVMNAVAMSFIVNIDEILFESILPVHHREDVENIDFLLQKESEDDSEVVQRHKLAFRKALLYIVLTLVYVVVYAEYVQDVAPREITMVKSKCEELLADNVPVCSGWTWLLQGNPSAHDCFPFPAPAGT